MLSFSYLYINSSAIYLLGPQKANMYIVYTLPWSERMIFGKYFFFCFILWFKNNGVLSNILFVHVKSDFIYIYTLKKRICECTVFDLLNSKKKNIHLKLKDLIFAKTC